MKFELILQDESGNTGWATGKITEADLQMDPAEVGARLLAPAFHAARGELGETRRTKPVTLDEAEKQ